MRIYMKKVFLAAALWIMLCLASAYALGEYSPRGVNEKERYNINLFLSNFSEQGMTFYSSSRYTDAQLVDFAIFHTWYNRQDRIERGQWDVYNCRMSDEYVREIAKKYFGMIPEALTPSQIHYTDGYYYWQTTGGYMGMGVVSMSHVENMGDGRFGVYFGCYGEGSAWSAEDCQLRPEQAARKFAPSTVHAGYAVIDTNGGTLLDRSTWTLVQYDTLL